MVTVGSETASTLTARRWNWTPRPWRWTVGQWCPLRFLGESFGIKVQWDDEAKTAVLSSQG